MPMETIPRIFHQISYQGEDLIPAKYRKFRQSWRANHPDWQSMQWDAPAHRRQNKACHPRNNQQAARRCQRIRLACTRRQRTPAGAPVSISPNHPSVRPAGKSSPCASLSPPSRPAANTTLTTASAVPGINLRDSQRRVLSDAHRQFGAPPLVTLGSS
jgi:hypothetical protein